MKKWYIFFVTGEGDNVFVCDFTEEEFGVVERLIKSQIDGWSTSYCGYLQKVGGPFETQEEAINYVANKYEYVYCYGDYDDECEDEEEEDRP